MRERILLFIILSILGVFLYVFQNHVNTVVGFLILCGCMVTYGLYSIAATKYQKRKLKKHPIVINENYKPFVSIMVPAHNEESVIANTVENILAIDYPNFEVIVIDDRSSDNTAKVVNELADKYENCWFAFEDGKTAKDFMQTEFAEIYSFTYILAICCKKLHSK